MNKRLIVLLNIICLTAVFTGRGIGQDSVSTQTSVIPDSLPGEKQDAETAQKDSISIAAGTTAAGMPPSKQTAQPPPKNVPEFTELISFYKVFWSIIILFLAYGLSRIVTLMLDNLSERTPNYRLLVKRLTPFGRTLIWIAAIYIVIRGVIAPPLEALLAVTASVGIAVGFASQDILKNIFGGIMIILDRPFQVGDKIQAGEYYGEVLQIGLRSVRIVTPDDSIVTIPNGELMNKSVSNANSGALDCQVVAEIFLPATVDIQEVKTIARRAAETSRYIYLNKPIAVIVKNEIHERTSFVKLRVKAYVLDIRYEFSFMSEMTELILAEINRKELAII